MDKMRFKQVVAVCRMLCVIAAIFHAGQLKAQYVDEEYRMDLGVTAGAAFYMGDANYKTPLADARLAVGIDARFNLNQRMAVRTGIRMMQIAGDTRRMEGVFPGGEWKSFQRTLYECGGEFELNFWPYGNGWGRGDIRRFTPYITAGLMVIYAPAPQEDIITPAPTLGAGVKYKLAPRWNVTCGIAMRFSLSDKLDVTEGSGLNLDDPYGVESSGMKNKDSYGVLMLTVSYDLFARCNNCNKE
ncbi:MAG: hypothetical protein IJ467_02810 [Bacteroidaceae bacterium]|nr:hypothetical protein [Bacteroidaceae bacterium]